MKKMLLFILPAVLLTGVLSCKNTNLYTPVTPVVNVSANHNDPDAPPPGTPVLETPQAYNNYIMDRHQKVHTAILTIMSATDAQPEITGSTIEEALTQINQLINEVKLMPPYRGSDTYRDAAIALFEFYATTFTQGYRQMADYTKTGSRIPQKEVSEMQNLLAAISADEKKMYAVFQVEQQMFADTNHFVLANTTTQPEVDYLR